MDSDADCPRARQSGVPTLRRHYFADVKRRPGGGARPGAGAPPRSDEQKSRCARCRPRSTVFKVSEANSRPVLLPAPSALSKSELANCSPSVAATTSSVFNERSLHREQPAQRQATMTASTTGGARKGRAYRARQRAGLAVLKVTVPHDDCWRC
jgi:hypothetical protein